MKKMISLCAVFLLFALFAQSAGAVNDVTAALPDGTTAMEFINAVKKAAKTKKWTTKSIDDKTIEAEINVRDKHRVKVTIVYLGEGFKVVYKDSVNMKYDASSETIHRKYYQWVNNLNREIIKNL